MKKLSFLFICLMFIACDNKPSPNENVGDTAGTTLITLSIGDIKHEFVKYKHGGFENAVMGISHWPDCKYCKKCEDN